jgi:hypothetical protein
MTGPCSSVASRTHVQVANGRPHPVRVHAPAAKAIRVGRRERAPRRTAPAATAVPLPALANVHPPLAADQRAKAHGGRAWVGVPNGMPPAAPDRRALPNGRQDRAKVSVPSAKAAAVHVRNDHTPKDPEAATGRAVQAPGKAHGAVIVPSAKAAAVRVLSGPTPKAPEAATGHAALGHRAGMNGAVSARNVPRSMDLPRISEVVPPANRHGQNATWAPVARRPRMD